MNTKGAHLDRHDVCPICKATQKEPIGEHIRVEHGGQALADAVLDAKRAGMSDALIGERFGITFKQLEHIITRTYGANVSVLSRAKRIQSWAPPKFHLEPTTVWSFRQRGNWATHDGRYRGNWSPYIPRNLILRYTQPDDLVLDPFVGGGTTAVEAKLLGRRCIARDINPACVELTLNNLRFSPPPTLFSETTLYEPEVSVGDARHLQGIANNSVDLICAHPPYAGIISYSLSVEGDLSRLSLPEFLQEMSRVASECYRVLKNGKKCAVLIGDTRQRKHVVPIGFKTIEVFLRSGFRLRELIIKRQHNCKTTGFWAERSVRQNFLLLAHEYLPVFEKPEPGATATDEKAHITISAPKFERISGSAKGVPSLETTTAWIFPPEQMEDLSRINLVQRYSSSIIRACAEPGSLTLAQFKEGVRSLVEESLTTAKPAEFLVIQTKDTREGRYLLPLAKVVVDLLEKHPRLWLKEVIVVAPKETPVSVCAEESLHIVHQYFLVYEVTA